MVGGKEEAIYDSDRLFKTRISYSPPGLNTIDFCAPGDDERNLRVSGNDEGDPHVSGDKESVNGIFFSCSILQIWTHQLINLGSESG